MPTSRISCLAHGNPMLESKFSSGSNKNQIAYGPGDYFIERCKITLLSSDDGRYRHSSRSAFGYYPKMRFNAKPHVLSRILIFVQKIRMCLRLLY